jgi:hypothetical protein
LRKRALFALSVAAVAIAARLPFLISGKIPFDSDEAVEGLMARHVLNGELPAFVWGQAYKGVPEAYASAVVFAMFGSSVAGLKSVTLGFFALYVALNFILLDRIASRWIAIAGSLLLVFAPPAFVLWSLSASAEYVLVMLLGTILLLLCLRLEGTGRAETNRSKTDGATGGAHRAKGVLFGIGLVAGLGLWVHQLFVVYLLPVLSIHTLRSEWWARGDLGRPKKVAVFLGALAVLYLTLGLIAFVTGGFSIPLASHTISATAPQKLFRIAVGFAGLAVLAHVLSRTTAARARAFGSRYWPLATGVCFGYLPVVLYSVLVEMARSPVRIGDLADLAHAAPDIIGNIVPILAGFKLATTERLAVPLATAVPAAAALAGYLWINRGRLARFLRLSSKDASIAGDFFPLFVLFVPALFVIGGVYIDTQSYRYLIPWYAGVSVAWATGALTLTKERRRLAAAVVVAIAAVHSWQQWLWYQKLVPDSQSLVTIDCLKRNGIRGGSAEYWTSYKLTFLSLEEVIIAPIDGVDRYPRYTEIVRTLPEHQKVRLKPDTTNCKE